MTPRTVSCLVLAGLFHASCATPEETKDQEPEKRTPVFASHSQEPLPRTWTTEFQSHAVFFADDVLIDGPRDLLQHVATEQDPETFEFSTRTVPDGLRQETTLREGVAGREIRAQLDGWTIVAMRRLVVLQRPGEAPVRLIGKGSAVLLQGGKEQRASRLEFRGEHGAP